MQPCVREKREIPSKTGALTLRDKRDRALINAIICQSEIANGNHQKLVSSPVCLRDDPVHPVDLALAAQQSHPSGAVWREFLGTKLPGLELLGVTWLSCLQCPSGA